MIEEEGIESGFFDKAKSEDPLFARVEDPDVSSLSPPKVQQRKEYNGTLLINAKGKIWLVDDGFARYYRNPELFSRVHAWQSVAKKCPKGFNGSKHVLDVGSGIGGASRYLASEYGCQVAQMLADRMGLGELVTYRQGNARDMPFEDAAFDLVSRGSKEDATTGRNASPGVAHSTWARFQDHGQPSGSQSERQPDRLD